MINVDEVFKVLEANIIPHEKASITNMFLSICYYYGALTTTKITDTDTEHVIILGIPNDVARKEYLTKINGRIDPAATSLATAKETVRTFITDNDPKPMLKNFLAGNFHIITNVRGSSDAKSREEGFQAEFESCLNLVRDGTFELERQSELKSVRKTCPFPTLFISLFLHLFSFLDYFPTTPISSSDPTT